jgi:hypothetical protein
MNVHILTPGVRENEAPSASWTHLVLDKSSLVQCREMPDIWLVHQASTTEETDIVEASEETNILV